MSKKTIFIAMFTGLFYGRFHLVVSLSLFILLPVTLSAQDQSDIEKPQILVDLAKTDGQNGIVELVQPVQVENLLKLQISNNLIQKGIPGYRIRIFSQSGQPARQKANDTRTTFMKSFPEIEAYLEYDDPNFQIMVGDFRTYTEAYHEKKKIEKTFPGAFVVNKIINIPK